MVAIDPALHRALERSSRRWFRDRRRRSLEERREAFLAELRLLSQPQSPEQLTEILTRDFAADLPEMVGRAQAVQPAILLGATRARVLRYISEATAAFIRGDCNAVMMLCRSAVEGALKQQLARRGRSVKAKGLEKLIDVARVEGRLTPRLARKAHKIRRRGNRYVHARRMSRRLEEDARETLSETIAVLRYLFPIR